MNETLKVDITPQDFIYLCRTCLSTSNLLEPIISKTTEGLSISYLMKSCLSLEVNETDALPQNICINCIYELKKIHSFRYQCSQNDYTLKSILENVKLEAASENFDIKNYINSGKSSDISPVKNETSSMVNNSPDDSDSDDTDNFDGLFDCTPSITPAKDVSFNTSNNQFENVIPNVNSSADDEIKSEDDSNDKNGSSDRSSDERNSPVPKKRRKTRLDKLNLDKFECRVCYDQFPNKEELKKHANQKKHSQNSNRKRQMCEICAKTVVSVGMKQHMRTHTNEKPFKCKECNAAFNSSNNLNRHMSTTHSDERPYVCELCGKGFKRPEHLKKHKNTMHTNNGKSRNRFPIVPVHVCDICNSSFKIFESFKNHIQTSHQEYLEQFSFNEEDKAKSLQYVCDVCNKSFKARESLRQHRVIHGEKSLLCTECGKAFWRKANLDVHLRTHTGERPYKCKVCSKAFSSCSSYRAHMNIHKGVKSFSCNVCSKRFTQQSHLTYHLRIHNGERQYACTYCGKSFTLKGTLTVHLRTHTGDTPYVCPKCGKGFYDSSSRKKHCKKSHNFDI